MRHGSLSFSPAPQVPRGVPSTQRSVHAAAVTVVLGGGSLGSARRRGGFRRCRSRRASRGPRGPRGRPVFTELPVQSTPSGAGHAGPRCVLWEDGRALPQVAFAVRCEHTWRLRPRPTAQSRSQCGVWIAAWRTNSPGAQSGQSRGQRRGRGRCALCRGQQTRGETCFVGLLAPPPRAREAGPRRGRRRAEAGLHRLRGPGSQDAGREVGSHCALLSLLAVVPILC